LLLRHPQGSLIDNMIQGFEATEPAPVDRKGVQWGPAIGAGFVAGVILMLVPRGSPWASLTFFTPVIIGRNASQIGLGLGAAYTIHLALSIVYGLLISRTVAHLRQARAVITGGILGLILYVANFGVVSTWWPGLRGYEISVVFTHVVFGLIAAGAYRGLLRRKELATPMSG
jgi:hypothetical protein